MQIDERKANWRFEAQWVLPAHMVGSTDFTDKKKGLSFISNRQRRKEGTYCASGLAGIEPTPPAPEEQGMCAFRQLG